MKPAQITPSGPSDSPKFSPTFSLPSPAEYRVGPYVERVTVLTILASGAAVVAHADGQLEAVSLDRCRLLVADETS